MSWACVDHCDGTSACINPFATPETKDAIRANIQKAIQVKERRIQQEEQEIRLFKEWQIISKQITMQ